MEASISNKRFPVLVGLLLPLSVALVPALTLFLFLLNTPYEVEISESYVDYPARMNLGLQDIYPAPDDPFFYPATYSPFHLLLAGWGSSILSVDSLLVGRALSLVGGILMALAVFLLARRLEASEEASVACGLLILGLHPAANFIGLNRTDPLAMGLALLGTAISLSEGVAGSKTVGWITGALMMTASFFFHPRAVVMAVAVLGAAWLRSGSGSRFLRQGLVIASVILGAGAALLTLVHIKSQGRALFYIITLPGSVDLSPRYALRVFAEAGLLWGGLYAVAVALMIADRRFLWFAPLLGVPALANVFLCLNTGAARNYFMPVTASACAMMAAALSAPHTRRFLRQAAWGVFAASAVVHGTWTWIHQFPLRGELARRLRLVEPALSTSSGTIFSSAYSATLTRTRPDSIQTFYPLWLTRRCAPEVWRNHVARLRHDLREGKYSLLLLPVRSEIPITPSDLEARYVRLPEGHVLTRAYGEAFVRIR